MSRIDNNEKVTVLNRLEIIVLGILSSLKVSAADYCDLETIDGENTIVYNNGSLMTILAYDGTKTIIGQKMFNDQIERLTDRLQVFLNKSGHQFGMVFRKDLNPTSDLYRIAEIKKTTAANLELDVGFLIDEEQQVYSKFVYDETNYIVLISHPKLLDSSEVSLEAKRKSVFTQKYQTPAMADTQAIFLANSYLKSQHDTYVEATLTALADPTFAAQVFKLNVVDALRAIKKSVAPQTTGDHWNPQIPRFGSNKMPVRWKTNYIPNDASHVLWQSLPEQIMRTTLSGVDKVNSGTFPVGSVLTENRIYTPLLVAVPPQGYVTFNALFESLNNASTTLPNGVERAIPYSITFMLGGDGLAGDSIKKTLANVLAVASSDNANIKSAYESLNNYASDGGVVVSLSISCMTWADNNSYGIDEIQIRRSKLWRTVETWGGAQIAEKGGDPILGFTSNTLGLTHKHHAPKSAAPLYDALYLLPWTRQASPYKGGTILNRSVDGKLMQHEAFSPELTTWVKCFSGKAGSGKSVALNNDLYECCLLAGLTRLPLIFMVDVGISSRGPIELLIDHLPSHKKHLAVYRRLQNDSRFAINCFDCAIGRMNPTANETAQIVAFLSTLITPVEAENKAEKGLSNFLTMIIEKTFISKMANDERGNPNIYEKNVNSELDLLLEDEGINARGLPYYRLVEICHIRNMYRARDLCHRLAMPILSDSITVATSDPEVQQAYGNTLTSMGGSFIQLFVRGIQEAQTMYPIFCNTTAFDVDTARVVSLDLQDVISSTNPKQSSLFFQIARMCAKKKIAFTEDDVPTFPPIFRAYYKKKVEELAEDKKILGFDELHNAKRDVALFNELLRDCREARKWNMMLLFASQQMEDFGEITRSATMLVIADRGTPQGIKYMEEAFSFQPQEKEALTKYVNLSPSGLTYLSRTVASAGNYTSLMTLTIGPQKLWALTTDPNDRLIRSAMYEILNDRPLALKILARYFPYGAKKVMAARREAFRNKKGADGNIARQDEGESIAKVMAKEIIETYQRTLFTASA